MKRRAGRKERRNQKTGNKPDYEPPGKCSTIRSGGGIGELEVWGKCDVGLPQAREITNVLSLAPGSVY
jgi:hypothetical protein